MFCSMCNAYADGGSLFFMYLVCSRCLMVRVLLVWPMYEFLQVLHVRLYIPLLSLSCVVSFVLVGVSFDLYCDARKHKIKTYRYVS